MGSPLEAGGGSGSCEGFSEISKRMLSSGGCPDEVQSMDLPWHLAA